MDTIKDFLRKRRNNIAKRLCVKRLAKRGLSLANLDVKTDDVFWQVAWYGSLGAGEAYMNEQWEPRGMDLTEFLTRVVPPASEGQLPIPPYEHWLLFKQRFSKVFGGNPQSVENSKKVAKEHYGGISNRVYELFMREVLKYTCVWYGDGATSHGQAQKDMLHRVAEKLGFPKKGQGETLRVLELGVGWGTIARFFVEHYNVQIVGVSNTPEQIEYAREHNAHDNIEYVLSDYRHLKYAREFDRVYSFGLFEHIGADNYHVYHEVVSRCLKDPEETDMCLSYLDFIGGNWWSTLGDLFLIHKIFPGGMSPSMEQFCRSFVGLFKMVNQEDNGPDYALTLEDWLEAFEKAWDEIAALGYDEKFRRMFRYYFCLCIAAFRREHMQNWGIVLMKLGKDPITRSYRFQ